MGDLQAIFPGSLIDDALAADAIFIAKRIVDFV